MAIRDNTIKQFINDRDENISIGIKYPPHRSTSGHDGIFEGTKTTHETLKSNLICLLKTEQGERIMQPNFGIPWKKYLFEQLDLQLIDDMKLDISNSINFWLPFVDIQDINITTNIKSEHEVDNMNNTIKVTILFVLKSDPTSLQQVSTEVAGD